LPATVPKTPRISRPWSKPKVLPAPAAVPPIVAPEGEIPRPTCAARSIPSPPLPRCRARVGSVPMTLPSTRMVAPTVAVAASSFPFT